MNEVQPIKITITDKILRATFLKFIPKNVTPNQVTIFRFFTIPFILFLLFIEEYRWGLALFTVSAFSDAVDGSLARTRNMITEWGETFDPVADKILISSVALIILPKFFGFPLLFALIFMEMILIGSAYYKKYSKKRRISANFWGKTKMVLQSVGLGLAFLGIIIQSANLFFISEILLYASLFFATISIITYGI